MITVKDYLGQLLNIIEEAEAAVMDIYAAHSAVVEIKSDHSPLTQADISSHRIISSGLARLFPDTPVVSEEGDEEANKRTVQAESFWLVDPLDGTKEFIDRTDEFTICVALIENDSPVFGIVAAPALGITYYGGPSMGSYKKLKGQEVELVKVSKKKVGVVLGSRSHFEEGTSAYVSEHYKHFKVKAVGSQLKLPQIAEGLADVYPRLGSTMHLWDLAAGHAILEGAGGTVAHPDGSPIDYHSQTLRVGDFVAQS
jgi:3'(2'), 5'-bisphosphate nucleotidase